MSDGSRRDALRFFGAAALLSAAGFSFSAPARASAMPRTLPQGEFRLSRQVERELFDGSVLKVRRVWTSRFASAGRGMQVEGEDLDCVVEAPGGLAALAEMERKRVGTGPFPALLSPTGLIVNRIEETPVEADEVVEAALKVLGAASLDVTDQAQARSALARVTSAAGQSLSAVPADLFFPETVPHSFSREIELAPGVTGSVRLETTSVARAGSGLLARFERRVVTRIGGDERLARELWTLDPA